MSVGMPVWWSIQRGHVFFGPLCGLEADRGDLADLWRVVVGHAMKEEGVVSGVGSFYLVPYGVISSKRTPNGGSSTGHTESSWRPRPTPRKETRKTPREAGSDSSRPPPSQAARAPRGKPST